MSEREDTIGNDELQRVWKAIFELRLMLCGKAPRSSNKEVSELQEHYLEHTIDRLPDGVRKSAALQAFSEIAFHSPKARAILDRSI